MPIKRRVLTAICAIGLAVCGCRCSGERVAGEAVRAIPLREAAHASWELSQMHDARTAFEGVVRAYRPTRAALVEWLDGGVFYGCCALQSHTGGSLMTSWKRPASYDGDWAQVFVLSPVDTDWVDRTVDEVMCGISIPNPPEALADVDRSADEYRFVYVSVCADGRTTSLAFDHALLAASDCSPPAWGTMRDRLIDMFRRTDLSSKAVRDAP